MTTSASNSARAQSRLGITAQEAIAGRHSVRRFLPKPVPEAIVTTILKEAARSASAANMQPWQVHVAMGPARDRLSKAVLEAAQRGERSDEYQYSPSPINEPYISRKRHVGYELYRLRGIERSDYPARKAAGLRNFEFFGAPVGLFFTLDRHFLQGAWIDCGLYMQNVMTLARDFGLETCAQQAWCDFGAAVHDALPIPQDQIILTGMALGYEDTAAPENALSSPRCALEDFVTLHRD